MKQYVVVAQDGRDTEALDRRMAARPEHLAGAKALKANNNFIVGGAMLNDDGKMIGSVMIVQFENDEKMKEWYDNEPYIQQGVWKFVEVMPFKVADI
ncbi:YCII-related protein [Emticicia oligotrophica DSM 17448]|uniref:YCII-related protein n=1 Tax=Emticicia oligotrophica (strain DSM 17448 / CIP 109782 / MTCC 6937 / GPTSA100-15) TaxID=929562 RepID=A0ABM5N2B7_EMTOG|nr:MULTISPECIES: YciI family protein [Emticicia]AFK03572.1 YCII-related protein [Emticicia oligotrophica DSM 17448]